MKVVAKVLVTVWLLVQVRLLDEQKEPLGVMSSDEAMAIAEEAGLDMVMMSPEAHPPVVRLMNYSKFKYQEDKRKREVKRHAVETRVEVKELKMRYNIGEADYGVRLRAVGLATYCSPHHRMPLTRETRVAWQISLATS